MRLYYFKNESMKNRSKLLPMQTYFNDELMQNNENF